MPGERGSPGTCGIAGPAAEEFQQQLAQARVHVACATTADSRLAPAHARRAAEFSVRHVPALRPPLISSTAKGVRSSRGPSRRALCRWGRAGRRGLLALSPRARPLMLAERLPAMPCAPTRSDHESSSTTPAPSPLRFAPRRSAIMRTSREGAYGRARQPARAELPAVGLLVREQMRTRPCRHDACAVPRTPRAGPGPRVRSSQACPGSRSVPSHPAMRGPAACRGRPRAGAS